MAPIAVPVVTESNPAYQLSPLANDDSSHPPVYEQFDEDARSEYKDMENQESNDGCNTGDDTTK